MDSRLRGNDGERGAGTDHQLNIVPSSSRFTGRNARLYSYPAASFSSMSTPRPGASPRSEEHTSELQSLMRHSYAVFCLKKKTKYCTPQTQMTTYHTQTT